MVENKRWTIVVHWHTPPEEIPDKWVLKQHTRDLDSSWFSRCPRSWCLHWVLESRTANEPPDRLQIEGLNGAEIQLIVPIDRKGISPLWGRCQSGVFLDSDHMPMAINKGHLQSRSFQAQVPLTQQLAPKALAHWLGINPAEPGGGPNFFHIGPGIKLFLGKAEVSTHPGRPKGLLNRQKLQDQPPVEMREAHGMRKQSPAKPKTAMISPNLLKLGPKMRC